MRVKFESKQSWLKPFDRDREETKKPLKNFLAPRTNFMLLHFLLSQQLNSLPFVVKPHPFHISRWSQAICQKLVQNKFAGTVRMKYKLKPARPRGKEGTCLFLKQSLCGVATELSSSCCDKNCPPF